MNTVISCAGLLKNYSSKQVLKGVDLEVPAGTIFALLGTNGAGKTTLIRTLLGLIPKTSGAVSVLGEEPYQIGPLLRQRIGYVSEEQGLYGWMSVAEIVRFCRSLYPNWNDELTQKYLQRFKLDPKTKIRTLSKGMTVKLALLLALCPEPELLILDEPMTGLDPIAQHEFLQVMRDVSLEGRSIFFSTHILADVSSVAQQVAILYNGAIQATGTLSDICNRVAKLTFPSDHPLPAKESGVVLLNATTTEKTVLVAADQMREIAATIEGNRAASSVSLEEAFIYFCGGGED